AYDNAARYLEQAIEAAAELDRPAEKVTLLEELGDMRLNAGRREETIRAYEDAVHLWKSLPAASPQDGARLYRKLGEVARWGWRTPRTREYIQEGLRLLEGTPDSSDRVKLMIAQAFEYYWHRREADVDYSAAEASAREAIALAQATGSLEDMSAALDALAGIYWQTAEFPKMRAVTEERGPILERLDNSFETLDYLNMLARAQTFLGDFAGAAASGRRAQTEAEKFAGDFGLLYTCADQAWLSMLWNRWTDVDLWCDRYDEIQRRGGYNLPLYRRVTAYRALGRAVRGDREAAREALRSIVDAPRWASPAMAWSVPFSHLVPGIVLGDREACAPLLDESLRLAETPSAKLEVQRIALEYAARFQQWEVTDRWGEDTLARARRSEAKPYIAQCCRALASHRRATDRLEEAETLISEAVRLFGDLDCPWDLGLALRELAMLRRIQGRMKDAEAALQEALSLFERNGARPDAEETGALLS
ncbi:MAG TPA: hypothetical protein VI007_10500, partial [bacterium]